MSATLSRTYCLCLYCGLDTKLDGLSDILGKGMDPDFYDERDHIDEIMESLGGGAEYLGGSGRTTTWNVEEDSMPELLRRIQDYNSRKEYSHIIHIQLY